jgi:hypothetical protein
VLGFAPAATAPAAPASPSAGKVKKLDSVEKMERAILKVLDDEDPKKVAAKLDVEPADVTAWVEAYQTAGREALRKL